MIRPTNISTNPTYYSKIPAKQTQEVNTSIPSFELSGYKTGQAILARNNISFYSQPFIKKITPCCTLILTDEPCNPTVQINMMCDKNFKIKQGLFLIYSMALNDQIYEQNQRNGGVITSYLSCRPNSKKIDFTSNQDEFIKSVKMLNDCFFKTKIDEKHIDTAKKLAPVALFLSRKTDEYQEELFDIPKDMTEEQYEKLIQTISQKDLAEYSNDLFKNSQLKVNIYMNKEYYNQNSHVLLGYFKSWSNVDEN